MSRPQILVVEDDGEQREQLCGFLRSLDLHVRDAEDLATARDELNAGGVDVVVTDFRLPDGTALDLLSWATPRHPLTDFIVATAYGTVETAVEAMRLGADDFLTKPIHLDVLEQRVRKLLQKRSLEREVRALTERLQGRVDAAGVVAESAAMQKVLALVQRVARTGSSVLITGESGTGKELIADLVHTWSRRPDGPFVRINCGALPESLLSSELFGHRRGAFTGADQDRDGLFVAADGGTLLLDEIGEISAATQVQLLRVLQEKEVVPVGHTKARSIDVRIVAATNRDLAKEVEAGRFRQDLYFRLNVIHVEIPPLRERLEDVAALIPILLRRYAEEMGVPTPRLTRPAHDLLLGYSLPGNVRELQNIMQRVVILSDGDQIRPEDLPESLSSPTGTADALPVPDARRSLPELVAQIEQKALRRALLDHGCVRARAARALGIPERVLRYKLKSYGIDPTKLSHSRQDRRTPTP